MVRGWERQWPGRFVTSTEAEVAFQARSLGSVAAALLQMQGTHAGPRLVRAPGRSRGPAAARPYDFAEPLQSCASRSCGLSEIVGTGAWGAIHPAPPRHVRRVVAAAGARLGVSPTCVIVVLPSGTSAATSQVRHAFKEGLSEVSGRSVPMDPTDLATKVNTAANAVLDILKKEWFLSLLLWLLIVTELSALWVGRRIEDVIRSVLVDDLGWTLIEPVISGVERVVYVALRHDFVKLVAIGALGLLLLATFIAFWSDGRRLPHTVIVEVAPLNVMLRFTVLTTVAMLYGTPGALIVLLTVSALIYAIGAASNVSAQ